MISKHFYCEGVRKAHQVLKDPKQQLSIGHKCYIRKDSRGATLLETCVNLGGMAADLDRLTGFIEAERPHTGRAENSFPKKKKRLAELDRPGLWDEGHIFLLSRPPFMLKPLLFFSFLFFSFLRALIDSRLSTVGQCLVQVSSSKAIRIKSLELKLRSRAIRHKNNREKFE